MPNSNQPPLLPLDYETPPNPPARRHRRLYWIGAAVGVLFLLLLVIADILPQLGRMGPPAMRIKSAANLRSIGQCIVLYCNDNSDQYPDSFATILLNEDVTSGIFINPASNDTPAVGPTTQAVANQLTVGGHLSYIYMGRGLNAKTVTPDTIVAYEIPLTPPDGVNILFADGHVEWFDNTQAPRIIAKAASSPIPVTMPSP
jgi:prepilin-type processing-associated H-X9-DG protein